MAAHRYVAAALFAASLLVSALVYLLYHDPASLGLCRMESDCFDYDLFYGTVRPLYLHARLLPLLIFLALFVRREVFFTWLACFGVLAVAAALLAYGAVPLGHDFLPGPDRPWVIEKMAGLIVKASLAVIALTYLHLWWKERT